MHILKTVASFPYSDNWTTMTEIQILSAFLKKKWKITVNDGINTTKKQKQTNKQTKNILKNR